VPSDVEQIISRQSSSSVKQVLMAEKLNYDVLVRGKPGRYEAVNTGIKEPIPHPDARPEAG
jgi:hypothetical protein